MSFRYFLLVSVSAAYRTNHLCRPGPGTLGLVDVLCNLIFDPFNDAPVVLDSGALLESETLVPDADEEVPTKRTGLAPPFEDIGDLVIGKAYLVVQQGADLAQDGEMSVLFFLSDDSQLAQTATHRYHCGSS